MVANFQLQPAPYTFLGETTWASDGDLTEEDHAGFLHLLDDGVTLTLNAGDWTTIGASFAFSAVDGNTSFAYVLAGTGVTLDRKLEWHLIQNWPATDITLVTLIDTNTFHKSGPAVISEP